MFSRLKDDTYEDTTLFDFFNMEIFLNPLGQSWKALVQTLINKTYDSKCLWWLGNRFRNAGALFVWFGL